MNHTTDNSQKVSNKFFCDKCDYGCSKKCDFDKHINSKKHNTTQQLQKVSDKFFCEKCNYGCSKKNSFDKHINSKKHNTTDIQLKHSQIHTCACGKQYNHRASLYNHKKMCDVQENSISQAHSNAPSANLQNTFIDHEAVDKRDIIIDELMKSQLIMRETNDILKVDNHEIKNLIMLLVEKYQENATKMGNVTNTNTNTNTNSHNNTLNFYLTHTCKDAESIHDFTERFVERSAGFFKDNFRQIADNQTNFASGVYDIFWKCLEEKPQTEKFIQTTDVKNGVLYVKEKKKDEQRQLCGEAEFVKYMDGFEKAGLNLGHAMNKAFLPLQMEFVETMKAECGMPPNEEDFEDEDEYETARHKYKERVIEMKHKMCMQTHNATTIFDRKQQRDEILSKTRRAKEPIE